MPTLPPDFTTPFNYKAFVDAFRGRDADTFAEAMKTLFDAIATQYQEIAGAINAGVDFVEAAAQPMPDNGHLLVWKDTGTGIYYLLFNDSGTVKSCTFS